MPTVNFPLIIGNWKMNLTPNESETVAKKIITGLSNRSVPAEIVLCPAFTSLERVQKIIGGNGAALGAQNVFWKDSGPYTGEISLRMLKEIGCGYVIIGHSERRINFQETDEEINKKVKAILQYDMVPVLCVGEKFEERQAGMKDVVLMNEVSGALKGIDKFKKIIIAYEPIWVIGRGEAIDPPEAQSAATVIEYTLRDKYPQKVISEKIKILYGGSVDDKNVTRFVDNSLIDGVLVGGSSLNPDVFLGIINNLTKTC